MGDGQREEERTQLVQKFEIGTNSIGKVAPRVAESAEFKGERSSTYRLS